MVVIHGPTKSLHHLGISPGRYSRFLAVIQVVHKIQGVYRISMQLLRKIAYGSYLVEYIPMHLYKCSWGVVTNTSTGESGDGTGDRDGD